MAELDIQTIERGATRDRREAERDALDGLKEDGRRRRRSNKLKPFLYRCTEGRWDKVKAMAKTKSAGADEGEQVVTYTAVIDEAIDLLDAVMKGEKRVI